MIIATDFLLERGIMDSEIKEIIRRLEHQRKSIDKAIAALHELDGSQPAVSEAPAAAAPATQETAVRKGTLSDEGRRRLAASMKARWAVKKKASAGKRRGLRVAA